MVATVNVSFLKRSVASANTPPANAPPAMVAGNAATVGHPAVTDSQA